MSILDRVHANTDHLRVTLPDPDLPPPVAFGIDGDRFPEWRRKQSLAITLAVDSDARFIFQSAPTGFGKSLAYVGQAMITGHRTCILTSTKALQHQLMTDFSDTGLVDIRGQNSYGCIYLGSDSQEEENSRVSCAEGPCKAGVSCQYKDGGCTYYDAVRSALASNLVVTNYAYWMTMNKYAEGLGPFDLLVLDEGHDAPDELSGFLSITLTETDVRNILESRFLGEGASQEEWRAWASYHAARLLSHVDTLKHKVREEQLSGMIPRGLLREVGYKGRLLSSLLELAGMRGEWVCEVNDRQRIATFDPVWPREYAERYLFAGVKKVVIFSATVRPKTADYLGIHPRGYDFNEYPSTFPVERRPVYHVPTVQLSHRSDPSQVRLWLNRADQIIGSRLDRKGIFHTISYSRRNYVLQHSAYSQFMVVHDPDNTRSRIDYFKAMEPPAILVSPSVGTGYDFPYDECEYQIVGKVPFPDTRSAVLKARTASDKDYVNYIAMQNLVQMTGRGMRAEDDRCETLIIDDNIEWFMRRNRHHAPRWFLDSYRRLQIIPAPPPKL